MLTKLLIGAAIGAVIGGSLGKRIGCSHGGCPFKKFPLWGIVIGSLIGLLLALNVGVASSAFTEAKGGAHTFSTATAVPELNAYLRENPGKTLVVFTASWCPACVRYESALNALVRKGIPSTKIIKINVDQAKELAGRFSITTIPTSLLYHGGELAERFSGARSESYLQDLFAD